MSNLKITDLSSLSQSSLDAAADFLLAVDVSDTTMAVSGTNVKISPKSLVGGSLSDLVQTWNNGATVFTGFKLNITDTSSSSSSLLIDLQVGGSSQFKVSKSGALTTSGLIIGQKIASSFSYTYGQPQFYSSVYGTGCGFQVASSTQLVLYTGGVAMLGGSNDTLGIRLNGSYPLGFVNGHAIQNTPDVTLRRNATGPKLEIRAASGLSVKNADGSDDANISCETISCYSIAASTMIEAETVEALYVKPTELKIYDADLDENGKITLEAYYYKFKTTDNTFSFVQGKLTTDTNYTAGAPTATGYLVLYDAAGTAYKVPAVAV